MQGACSRGFNCPYRHIKGERVIVCKHWLRQLCNKGDECEFLHEYDMGRMPVCYFFQKFGKDTIKLQILIFYRIIFVSQNLPMNGINAKNALMASPL